MTHPLTRRRAAVLGALTVPIALVSGLLLGPAASAEVIGTRDITAGPVNRGIIAITSVTCERTDAPGDFGRLTIAGDVLVPPTSDGTVSIRVNDKVTDANYAVLPLESGATTFATTIAADGLVPLPAMELVVSQVNPATGVASQRDRVVTSGRCGWPDFARLPVPEATSVDFTGLVPSAVITNEAAWGLAVNVRFTACARVPGSAECTNTETVSRVVVPPGGTASAAAPAAVAPDSVVVVQTGIVGRDLETSRYLGEVLVVGAPSA